MFHRAGAGRALVAALLLSGGLSACSDADAPFIARCKEVTNGSPQCSCAASVAGEMMGDDALQVMTLIFVGQRGAAEVLASKKGLGPPVAITGKWSIAARNAGLICNISGLDRM